MNFDIIVVGGGHAGCEASLAAARMGNNTLLITGNIKNIADMPCNPSIGGSAKGVIVREIDALGGEMGRNADKGLLQIKMLNISKGPAVQALRAQADKVTYPKEMQKTLKAQKNLIIKENLVEDLIVNNNVIKGVITENGEKIYSKIVILTTGTYLKSDIMVGAVRRREGPHGEKPSNYLSDKLKKYGLKIIRLKTGTPQRIDKNSIDFSKSKIENGDKHYHTFSYDGKPYYDVNKQVPCHLIYTTPKTHEIIKQNLKKSSMYGGLNDVTGIGPRYCPSIEDKIVKFSDKKRHQLFLEPESLYYNDIYLQGFSTSMPHDIQDKMVHSLPGLEKAKILKYAYAIEYDAIDPIQLNLSLENKVINNLFTAGQINGTSGYEEAACQGLIAGINASLKLQRKDPLILKRSEAYIGVLIDDLVTKGIIDPYRMLTSRAEYRLLLRSDNANIRLRKYGYRVGLVTKKQMEELNNELDEIQKLILELKTKKINPSKANNQFLESLHSANIKDGISLYNLLKRPEIKIHNLKNLINNYSLLALEQAEISIKYEGYIKKIEKSAQRLTNLEKQLIPNNINYDKIHNLASEAKQKLHQIKPKNLAQASRISGVNPIDLSLISIYLRSKKND